MKPKINEYLRRWRSWKKAHENNDAFTGLLGTPEPQPSDFGITDKTDLWYVEQEKRKAV